MCALIQLIAVRDRRRYAHGGGKVDDSRKNFH